MVCAISAASQDPNEPQAPTALEVRAFSAFNAGDDKLALPLLRQLLEKVGDDARKRGQIEEMIRVAEKRLLDSLGNPNIPQPPEKIGTNRVPHRVPKDGEIPMFNLRELGNFDYDPDEGGNIPDDVKKLSGATIRVRGFMIPMEQAENITTFALVYDLFACCFGQPPQIQHTVVVNTPKGKAVSYFPDEIIVEGKLKVEEKRDEGFIVSIFEIECTSVRPAPRP
jgi:hypothetical protein